MRIGDRVRHTATKIDGELTEWRRTPSVAATNARIKADDGTIYEYSRDECDLVAAK